MPNSTATITTNNSDSTAHYSEVALSRDVFKTSPPKFQFEHARWATSRAQNVEEIANQWKSKPDSVWVFVDPKLRDCSLVMLRKDRFETMLKQISDLHNGQAFVRHNTRTLLKALVAAKGLLKSKEKEAGEALASLDAQLDVILHLSSEIEATIFVKKSGFVVEPSPLTPEELASLKEEENG
jgi:hypothetical protein